MDAEAAGWADPDGEPLNYATAPAYYLERVYALTEGDAAFRDRLIVHLCELAQQFPAFADAIRASIGETVLFSLMGSTPQQIEAFFSRYPDNFRDLVGVEYLLLKRPRPSEKGI